MVIEWGLDQAYLFDRRTGKQVPLSFRKAMIVSPFAPSSTSIPYSLVILLAAYIAQGPGNRFDRYSCVGHHGGCLPLHGLSVSVPSAYHLLLTVVSWYRLYLAGRGLTTNEAFKWEVLEDAIDRGDIWIVEETQASKKNKNGKNDTKDAVGQSIRNRHKPATFTGTIIKEHQVTSLDEIDNIYDHGFFKNLKHVFFPKPIPS